jgi:hypothetical protein
LKYNLNEGVDRKEENVQRSLMVSLPIVFAVLLFALFHAGTHQTNKPAPTNKPKTLSISTNKPSSDTSNGSSAAPSGSTSTGSGTTSGQVSSTGVGGAGAGTTSTTTPPVTGGRGGGGGGTGGGGSGGAGVVACDNTGGVLPITCTACAPAILVPVGQKAVLATNGTCALIN